MATAALHVPENFIVVIFRGFSAFVHEVDSVPGMDCAVIKASTDPETLVQTLHFQNQKQYYNALKNAYKNNSHQYDGVDGCEFVFANINTRVSYV